VVLAASLSLANQGSHFNPFGIAALGVGVIVLIILLITFRRR
jgi:hypothetical protein